MLDAADWRGIHAVNALVRDVARAWTPAPDGTGVRWVLVQEFGDFANRLLWESARRLGYAVPPAPADGAGADPGWALAGAAFLLERLPRPRRQWPPSVPMVCAARPAVGARECPANGISPDGMHWCVETLGPRYTASIACLLGCVYNGGGPGKAAGEVRRCERECNQLFMSIAPVDKRWLRSGMTVFAS